MANYIPTVRVKSPVDQESYIVINHSDLRSHHELWPEQDEDFQRETSSPAKVATEYSDEELRLCVRIVAKFMANLLSIPVEQWRGFQPTERVRKMIVAENRIDKQTLDEIKRREELEKARHDAADPPLDPLVIGRGPKNKIYLMRGTDTFSGPYANQAEAEEALKIEQDQ